MPIVADALGYHPSTIEPSATQPAQRRRTPNTSLPHAISVDRLEREPPFLAASGSENASQSVFITFEIDNPADVLEGEHARRQAKNGRCVSAYDRIERSSVMPSDLWACVGHPHLKQLLIDRDSDRR
ncbi:hypothetical protein [Nonomuraea sp. B19D2]|uniref:hypothetical protein n=1 Tax=Nonomuraea sp. B19D2 TaxID=3159561 RepID=UPI0032DADFDB